MIFKAACIQLNGAPEIEPNLDQAEQLIRRASDAGAEFILTPETTDVVDQNKERLSRTMRREEEHPGLPRFADLARELDCWLMAGSFTIKLGSERAANRSYLFAADGTIAARYDKIHMFDVDIPDGQTYRESEQFRPGSEAVISDLPWGRLGMSICYDVRFAALYRALAQGGAQILSVPAAFTRFTGEAHWHALLRVRAIETGCFVLAPAQCGTHAEGRETFGHSLIVAPWGEVLADGGREPGFILAEIDVDRVAKARSMVPSLRGDRPFQLAPADPEGLAVSSDASPLRAQSR